MKQPGIRAVIIERFSANRVKPGDAPPSNYWRIAYTWSGESAAWPNSTVSDYCYVTRTKNANVVSEIQVNEHSICQGISAGQPSDFIRESAEAEDEFVTES